MHRVQQDDLVWYTFAGPGLDLTHACFTRLGGVSKAPWAALNLGSTVGDDPRAVQENHRRIFDVLGITRAQVVSPYQVHGRHVARVTTQDGGSVIPATDALITNTPGVALLLRFADCTPVLFYDPVQRAVGLAHAGWRGVAANIAAMTVQVMGATFGTRAADVWAGIGPTIGPQHYNVGAEVVAAIRAALPEDASAAACRDGRWYVDLPGAVAAQLRAVGVSQIENSGLCTVSHVDEWYSHRAENGRTGRFGVLAMLS
ncbi:MAG TPA: peptidoglycan editing factor PgeF [Anaerolineae bacterium]|nr:peptidoglycan editing factor PgeF [Anaerolineae bacterium]HQH37417.1 peptidoglycan editing factor PgeF [Anaerolineae bacterium]